MDMQFNNNHSFNINLAVKVGIEKALLLGRVLYFAEHNQKTGKCLRDGRYWMYDTSKNLVEIYPYLKSSSIRRYMAELESDGWLLSGNYNSRAYDKTKWYTPGDRFWEWLKNESLAQNEQGLKSDAQNEQGPDDLFAESVDEAGSIAENIGNPAEIAIIKSSEMGTTERMVNEALSLLTDAQNEQGSKSLAQNEQSIAQNERSIAQNEQPIPVIIPYSNNYSSSCSTNSDRSEFENSKDLEIIFTKGFRMVWGKNPNFYQVDEIKKLFLSTDGFTPEEQIGILRESITGLLISEDPRIKTVRYLSGMISGKMNDLRNKKIQKQKEAESLRNAAKSKREYEERWGKSSGTAEAEEEPADLIGALAEAFTASPRKEKLIAETVVKKEPKLVKGSAEYSRAEAEFKEALRKSNN
ncbi:MAG TPA: hypothetical protein VHO03_03770 [Ignavibacteriales bacterium]|nr:hypothetical protein [Ignavibacteriales bacterium]